MSLDTINFSVPLPAIKEPHDVVRRSLKVEYDDPNTPNDTISIPLEVHTVEGMAAPQDTKVKLTLTHIDDAGNESEPTVCEFTATDDVPPPAPGGFGVLIEGEQPGTPADPVPEEVEPGSAEEVDPDEPEAPEDTPANEPDDAPVGDDEPVDAPDAEEQAPE